METESNGKFIEVQSSRHQFVSRLEVPGGWLYEIVRAKTGDVALQFVPDITKDINGTLEAIVVDLKHKKKFVNVGEPDGLMTQAYIPDEAERRQFNDGLQTAIDYIEKVIGK